MSPNEQTIAAVVARMAAPRDWLVVRLDKLDLRLLDLSDDASDRAEAAFGEES